MSKDNYITNFILKELYTSSFNYLLKQTNNYGIYVIRIKMFHENKYMIKIGKTYNLKKRISNLFNEFNCCDSEIILLFYGIANNIWSEKYIHQLLKKNINMVE